LNIVSNCTLGHEVFWMKCHQISLTAAERRIPVYAEALYNRKALVQTLTEDTGETMPELLYTFD
jgi:hypothetical protein